MTRANIEYLKKHGPTPFPELPYQLHVKDKLEGAARITLTGGSGNGLSLGTGKGGPTSVAYLVDTHKTKEIIRAFLDENPSLVKSLPKNSLTKRFGGYGHEFQEAARDVLSEYDTKEVDMKRNTSQNQPERGPRAKYDPTCPDCGGLYEGDKCDFCKRFDTIHAE